MNRLYDAVIIGSGPTGGYAAKALTEAGLRVIVLDAGRDRRSSEARDSYDRFRRRLGYRVEEDPAAIRRQPVQSSCYAWPDHPHGFVDDVDNPYVSEADTPFRWIRSRRFGGRMTVKGHGLQFYRFSDLDFKAGERDGASPSWPLSYADVAPYYERVERWMGIYGGADAPADSGDDMVTGHSRPLNAGERLLKEAVERRWKGRRIIAGRTAPPPRPIVDALATGRCTLRSNAIVSRLIADRHSSRLSGAAFVDARTGRTREVRGRTTILCASSIESARLLLLSATERYSDGLANSSGTVGRYLMDHLHFAGIHATIPVEASLPLSWAYMPRFANLTRTSERFVRGYGIQVFTRRQLCALAAFGEMLPNADNRITVDRTRTDRWGVPVARVRCSLSDNDRRMAREQIETCSEMFEAARWPFTTTSRLSVPGSAVHEVGTARMGSDPKTSVLNAFCQSWDHDNLFVMDGSCFVTQGTQNPTLTMLALAARSCDYLLESFRRGDL